MDEYDHLAWGRLGDTDMDSNLSIGLYCHFYSVLYTFFKDKMESELRQRLTYLVSKQCKL